MHDTPKSRGPATGASGPGSATGGSGSATDGSGGARPGRAGGGVDAGPDPDRLADRYRDEFPILSEKAYLNSNSLGALSRRSLEARRAFERDWNEAGASSWYGDHGWTARLQEVRDAFGRTVGASPARSR